MPTEIAAAGPSDIPDLARLFRAYAASLPIDLGYQGFERELETLPGRYAPPAGVLLLARRDRRAVGCVGVREIAASVCEMKRLWVAPEARGSGLGAALVARAVAEAQRIGHREMRLDTLPGMAAAIGLYARMGFEPMEAYYPTPVAGTRFMRRALAG